MKPSRIFRLSRIPSTFHFVELAQLVILPPPLQVRTDISLFHTYSNLRLKRFCFFNGLNEVESAWWR